MKVDRKQLKLSIKIIADLRTKENLSNEEWRILGYDPYRFGVFGEPSGHEIKMEAMQYIADSLIYLLDKVEKENK